ncbi:MAG: molybdopterin molybdotransferase MoeA [Fibrobacterota bacterium]|nr:molybdopterin molybdotransferase MoeA [Fibrobacterota bacterium]
MDGEFREMVSPAEADAILAAALPRYPSVTLPLAKCQGRILREPILADRAQPPFDRVAMDGIAFAFSAWEKGLRRFAIEGMQKAGDRPKRLESESGCLEAMTGAVLPIRTDCIAPVEDISVADGYATLSDGAGSPVPFRYVHRAGADCAKGDVIVPEGVLLTAPHIGAAAAFGKTDLKVAAAPSVAIVATGDELVDPARDPLTHQIRRSNPPSIEAALKKRRIERVASLHCRDDRDRLHKCIEGVMEKCDVLILTGGVSMGKTDYVPGVLKALGVKPRFHRIRQKPGKPFWFGIAPAGTPVFALPGNPASVLVCLYRYVLPALERSMGLALGRDSGDSENPGALSVESDSTPAVLAQGTGRGKLTQFRPVRVAWDAEGRLRATWTDNQGSGDFSGWARSDGFVEIEAGEGEMPAGSVARLWRW